MGPNGLPDLHDDVGSPIPLFVKALSSFAQPAYRQSFLTMDIDIWELRDEMACSYYLLHGDAIH